MFLKKFLERKIPDLFKCFKSKFFKRVFGLKDQSSLVFKVFVNSKKIVFWEFIFCLKILYLFGDFFK